jgi:hypothetical protein
VLRSGVDFQRVARHEIEAIRRALLGQEHRQDAHANDDLERLAGE